MNKYAIILAACPLLVSGLMPSDTGPYTKEHGRCVDVSSNQEEVDWDLVKSSGVDYAVIRCASTDINSAELYTDRYFYRNISEAENAGTKTGIYFYTAAVTHEEMESNVNDVIDIIYGMHTDLPVYIDIESEVQKKLSKKELTEIALYGCRLLSGYGYEAGIYSNLDFMTNCIDHHRIADEGYSLWVAAYPDVSQPVEACSYDFSRYYDMWQYSDKAVIPGIKEYTDVSCIYRCPEEKSYFR